MYSEHDDGASQVLGTLRAEHGSAPTDHHRKNSNTAPELYCKNLVIIPERHRKNSNTAPDHHRKNLGTSFMYNASRKNL